MSDLPMRPSCRALLVAGDRLLLGRHRVEGGYTVWACPGGGVEPGETLLAALARELFEETGLVLAPDAAPPLVWVQTAELQWMRPHGFAGIRNHYFLIPVTEFDPVSGVAPGTPGHPDSEGIVEQRWWDPAAIETARASGVLFSPRALPNLLRRLLSDGPPATPQVLGL